MTLRLTAALTADVRGPLAAEVAAGERAARGAVTDTGRWTQEQLRGQVRSGFGVRSARLANTWRLAVCPTSAPTLRPAALVSSRAPAIIDAFDRGAVICPRGGGRYLAVPLEAIRNDRRIEEAEPGGTSITGRVTARLAAGGLLAEALADTPVDLTLGFEASAARAVEFRLPRCFLSRPRAEIEGPGGVSVTYDLRASADGVGAALSVTRRNGIASYA